MTWLVHIFIDLLLPFCLAILAVCFLFELLMRAGARDAAKEDGRKSIGGKAAIGGSSSMPVQRTAARPLC